MVISHDRDDLEVSQPEFDTDNPGFVEAPPRALRGPAAAFPELLYGLCAMTPLIAEGSEIAA